MSLTLNSHPQGHDGAVPPQAQTHQRTESFEQNVESSYAMPDHMSDIGKLRRDSATSCGEPESNTSVFAFIEEHPCFRNTTLVVIVLNALWIGIDVEWNHNRLRFPLQPGSTIVEHIFCIYFFMEVVVRFLAFRIKRRCIWDAWFVFDATLVVFMVLETWVLPLVDAIAGAEGGKGVLTHFTSFRLLRLLRLTRMAKLMRFFPELMTLIKSIGKAMQAVVFILLFLVIVMYVFAIIFTSQLGEPVEAAEATSGDDPTAKEMFSDLGSSMMTLFTNGVLGDNLAQTLMAIKDENILLMWLFVLFILISGITLLNMLIGVLCQVIDDSTREEEETRQIADLRSTLTEAFLSIDASNDGFICEAEWSRIKESSKVRASLTRLGVEESEMDERLNKMQETLFGQASVAIGGDDARRGLGFDEFVDKMIELRWDTPAKALDVEVLKATITLEDKMLKRRLDHIEANLTQLLAQPDPVGSVHGLANDTHEQEQSSIEPPTWLMEVPTELLVHVLKTR